MKLVPIFTDSSPNILSVKLEEYDDDEFRRIFDLWSDVEYLENFFEENQRDLNSRYNGFLSVEEAIEVTIEEAEELEDYLMDLAKAGYFSTSNNLQSAFMPLNNHEYGLTTLLRSKAYGIPSKTTYSRKKKSWLRIYALRIGPNFYIITGGAIKLTQFMGDRNHTKIELRKLEKVRDFLIDNELFEESDFENIELEF